jgi:hypothetical protein
VRQEHMRGRPVSGASAIASFFNTQLLRRASLRACSLHFGRHMVSSAGTLPPRRVL